eukprot:gene11258-18884_t
MQWVPPQAIPGLPIKPPRVPPQAGQVIVSYETIEPEVGCCKCSDLTTGGLIALIVLVLVFWPLAFIPCLQKDCHTQSQAPVYGSPPSAGGASMPMPTGQPTSKGADAV